MKNLKQIFFIFSHVFLTEDSAKVRLFWLLAIADENKRKKYTYLLTYIKTYWQIAIHSACLYVRWILRKCIELPKG